jgi:hypothetical protein
MREYDSGEKENKYTAHPWYYEILKYECGIEGRKSYSKHDKSYHKHDIYPDNHEGKRVVI